MLRLRQLSPVPAITFMLAVLAGVAMILAPAPVVGASPAASVDQGDDLGNAVGWEWSFCRGQYENCIDSAIAYRNNCLSNGGGSICYVTFEAEVEECQEIYDDCLGGGEED